MVFQTPATGLKVFTILCLLHSSQSDNQFNSYDVERQALGENSMGKAEGKAMGERLILIEEELKIFDPLMPWKNQKEFDKDSFNSYDVAAVENLMGKAIDERLPLTEQELKIFDSLMPWKNQKEFDKDSFNSYDVEVENSLRKAIGERLPLTEQKLKIFDPLMPWKNQKEFDFDAYSNKEGSDIFKWIHTLPKEASVQSHSSSALPNDLLNSYKVERNSLLENSMLKAIGGNLPLTEQESKVNDILMTWKNQEFDEGLANESNFWAGLHFFEAKAHIEESNIFKLIQKLPKGAQLHSHSSALVSGDYIFNNITFRDNLYVQEDSEGTISLKFFNQNPGLLWSPISEVRKLDADFNQRLKNQLTLFRDKVEVTDASTIWTQFENIFGTFSGMHKYEPVFRDYFYQGLKELYEDNVKYLEVRGALSKVYDGDGLVYAPEDVLQMYYDTLIKFMEDYPDFWGVRFILAPDRNTNLTVLDGFVDFIQKMNERFPNFVVGFDLVGQEDTGSYLKDFIPSLLKLKEVSNFFFHAGETLWNGMRIDENLIDAVLLNTSRIGHGYAVVKHPEVLKLVKERQIALEICPISNQVLGLVRDFRNHPANFLIANDYPVVIASDDPSFWGAKGLSYDWYVAFMGMASKHADLRLLKQLAINSIVYSSMEGELKDAVLMEWEEDWKKFLQGIIDGSVL